MALTVTNFNTLTQDLQSVFYETAEKKIAESTGLNKVFGVTQTELKDYKHQLLHGVSGIARVAEGSDFPRVTSGEGDSITATQQKYGANVIVTWDNREYWREENGNVFRLVQSITDDAFDKVDKSLADVLTNGWSTSYTDVYGESVTSVCGDALALFSATHNSNTATTFSNIAHDGSNTNPPLSRAAIVTTRKNALKYTDRNGLNRPIYLDTLLVPADLEDLAYRLIKSDKIPGSANNDINPEFITGMKIVTWPRLGTTSGGTDTSAYWYMFDSTKVKESLQCIWKKRPTLDAPNEIYANADWQYRLFLSYALLRGFPAYIRGSKGDNS